MPRTHKPYDATFRQGTSSNWPGASPTSSTILTPEQWAALPDEIQVRIVRFTAGGRGFLSQRLMLVNILLDAEKHPAAKLIAVYGRRWRLAVCLRDVKPTLGFEQLRCQSPFMPGKRHPRGLLIS